MSDRQRSGEVTQDRNARKKEGCEISLDREGGRSPEYLVLHYQNSTLFPFFLSSLFFSFPFYCSYPVFSPFFSFFLSQIPGFLHFFTIFINSSFTKLFEIYKIMADPAIKLFGTTIALPDDVEFSSSKTDHDTDKDDQDGNSCNIQESGDPHRGSEESAYKDQSERLVDDPGPSSGADVKAAVEPSKSEEGQEETNVSEEKTLKKPDKILPCPRCNSMDTKFCYYNNYNVNQPRHFCRNCQRYWTAGGNMRNVPVGAGRRKNKSSSPHYRQITVPETLQHSQPDIPNGIHPGMQTNGKVLTFGSDIPLCESMSSILNLAEKTIANFPTPNGFQKPDGSKIQIPCVPMETGDNVAKSSPKELPAQNCLPYPNQIPCFPGAPWTYPWNSGRWAPPVAISPISLNGLAFPYYPAPAYWGCTVPGTWNIPWIAQPSPATQSPPSSGPNSPTLGKHSRDGNVITSTSSEEKGTEDNSGARSLWVPKTLRIDDPEEASKSSIWTTLGIKPNENPGIIRRGSGLFKAFQSKCDETTPSLKTSAALEANPAALSRSHNFQEGS